MTQPAGTERTTLKRLLAGHRGPRCLTVTLVDGLVLARSAFHHSVNYRSVMVFGPGGPVDGESDYELDVWAGVVPFEQRRLEPEPDARLPADVPLPVYLRSR
jgi:nitroimidazol reductase NimA-like FMN-containing flavoprotein (pyridoxamine 5'-phosphate oxidase superfamily)